MTHTINRWQARAFQRIDSRPDAQLNAFERLRRNLHITEAYAELYLRRPDTYKWAGMAAITSAAVGRGMALMLGLRASGLGGLIGLYRREVAQATELLGVGNAAVFYDIYWQHLAYEYGGMPALAATVRDGNLKAATLAAWAQIDAGRRSGNAELVWQGNTGLLEYEQREVLQPAVYDGSPELWRELAAWVPSPLLGDLTTFAHFASKGSPACYTDRWGWISQYLLPGWRRLTEGQPARVDRALLGYMRNATLMTSQGRELGFGRLALSR